MKVSLFLQAMRLCCLSMIRLFFFWPALLIGSGVLGMTILQYQGGMASQVEYYKWEAGRWRDASEGGLMIWQCPDIVLPPVVSPTKDARHVDCQRAMVSFEHAAEKDFSTLYFLTKIVLVTSLCLELLAIIRTRSKRLSGEGRGARISWPVSTETGSNNE